MLKAVTRDGDMLKPDGLLKGGYTKKSQSILENVGILNELKSHRKEV